MPREGQWSIRVHQCKLHENYVCCNGNVETPELLHRFCCCTDSLHLIMESGSLSCLPRAFSFGFFGLCLLCVFCFVLFSFVCVFISYRVCGYNLIFLYISFIVFVFLVFRYFPFFFHTFLLFCYHYCYYHCCYQLLLEL